MDRNRMEWALTFALGQDSSGQTVVGDLEALSHLLIAGRDGTGVCPCVTSLVDSVLSGASPLEVRLILADTRNDGLSRYGGFSHLLLPLATTPQEALRALHWVEAEIERRLVFSQVEADGLPPAAIVVVIHELADVMEAEAKEAEAALFQIAWTGPRVGVHLVLATRHISPHVITGLIKATVPSRIAFAVHSAAESRIILDTRGAEQLAGGDEMLYFPKGAGRPFRVQGCFTAGQEGAAEGLKNRP